MTNEMILILIALTGVSIVAIAGTIAYFSKKSRSIALAFACIPSFVGALYCDWIFLPLIHKTNNYIDIERNIDSVILGIDMILIVIFFFVLMKNAEKTNAGSKK